MTKEEIIEKIYQIRDDLLAAPEVGSRIRRDFSVDSIDRYFDLCDTLNDAVSNAVDLLDGLSVAVDELDS